MSRAHFLVATFLLAACPAHAVDQDYPPALSATDLTGPDLPEPTPTTTGDPTTSDINPDTITTSSTTEPDTTTTAVADDTTTATATTGTSPECGDGEVNPGEQCDEGHGSNSDSTSPCTLACKLNVCGDGLVEQGVEICDHGVDNNDFLYDGCSTKCTRTDHCGDGEVNGPEECDRGEANNGTDDKDADAVPCSTACTHAALHVFLSSVTYAVPELGGGAYEADGRCRDLAEAALLANHKNYKAWISDKFSGPIDRFKPPIPDMPYALKNGLRVADDRDQLLASGPLTGITVTETGETIYDAYVWTDTKTNGTVFDATLACENWKSNSPLHKARVGRSGVDKADLAAWTKWQSQQQWTSFVTLGCHNKSRLYCVEQ